MKRSAPYRIGMEIALRLARSGKGITFPNPSVGAVLMRGTHIVAAARTQNGGRPHAEQYLLMQLQERNYQITADDILYVTMMPCAHHGETPPCVDAIIESGIRRVVIGCDDNDRRVRENHPRQKMHDAGIEIIDEGLCGRVADFYQGYLRQRAGLTPHLSLKVACSLDGKIALADGQSQWITGEVARKMGHLLRARADAVLTGAGTIIADDPELNCRLAGMQDFSPMKIIVAGKNSLKADARIFQSGKIFISYSGHESHHAEHAQQKSSEVTLLPQQDKTQQVNLPNLLQDLSKHGIGDILVEAGAALNASWLREKLVDRIYLFQSMKIIGNDGLSAFGDLSLSSLTETEGFQCREEMRLGQDRLLILDRIADKNAQTQIQTQGGLE